MTNGVQAGINGSARSWRPRWLSGGLQAPELGPMTVIIAVGLIMALVNATSEIIEAERAGHQLHPREPFAWEFSSIFILTLLAPLIQRAVARWPLQRETLMRSLIMHAALTLPFALVHVIGMAAIRKATYASWGGFYDFTHGQPLLTFVYEWRKDVISYAIIALIFWFFSSRANAAAGAPAAPERIEIRNGGTAVFLDPRDILRVEAAGNYVEFHTMSRTHLVRGALTAWAEKLAPLGFVRAHRSRIINRARIRAIEPTPAGDLMLTLDDDSAILASRRYRDALWRSSS